MTTEKRRPPQTRWGHPAITLSLGVIIGGAAWVGGEPVAGLAAFGLCAVTIVAWHVATARSERFRETGPAGRTIRRPSAPPLSIPWSSRA